MQAKLLKIKLNAGSKSHVEALIDYMQKNPQQPLSEMQQKGYFWDSVFFDTHDQTEYLYIVIKSPDFSKIMTDESDLVATDFRAVYEKFRQQCWAPEPYKDIDLICCFNQALAFSD